MDDIKTSADTMYPDMNPEPVMRYASDGTLVYANSAGKALMVQWAATYAKNKEPDLCSCWQSIIAEALEHGEVAYEDWSFQDRHYAICFSPIPGEDGGNTAIHLYFRDVSERVVVEQTLQAQGLILSAVAKLSSMILSAHDLHAVMPKVLAMMGEATGVSRVYIFEHHHDDNVLFCSQRYEWVDKHVEPQLNNADLQNIPMVEAGFGRWLEQFNQGKAVSGMIEEFPESEQDILKEQGILSLLVMPILLNHQVWGFVGFDACDVACVWTDEKENALSIAASSLGAALEREEDERSLFVQNMALKKARDEAEQASRAKSEFLAVMSHELRTPIHGAIGMLQLLQDTQGLNQEQKEYLEASLMSSKSLKLLVNDILDLSKVEADQVEIYAEPFDVLTCIQEVVSSLRYDVMRKGLYLKLEMTDVPKIMVSDVVRVRQILLNIIGNAVKFTAIGGITIRAFAADGRIEFNIDDTGIGIAEDKRNTIFEPFTQADASVNREFHGTGLGTTIAKRFVELLGGNIKVRSHLGRGSCFIFDLRCEAGDAERLTMKKDMLIIHEALHHKPKSMVALPKGMEISVLVAEDDPIGQKIIEKRLRRAGFSVTIASNGIEAWDWAQRQDFDLVILDMQMPGMNGADVATHIRTLTQKTGQAFIIGISAHALSEIKTQCIAAGMDDFMTKPLDAQQVIEKIVHIFDVEQEGAFAPKQAKHE